MLFNESVDADNNFARAYNALDKESKQRVVELTMVGCGIKSTTTFYHWLKNPELVSSPVHRRYIACTILGKEIKEIFGK